MASEEKQIAKVANPSHQTPNILVKSVLEQLITDIIINIIICQFNLTVAKTIKSYFK